MADPELPLDEQAVLDWAKGCKISPECAKLLIKDGFTSLEALALLEKEDIHSKISRGQHRLILQAVGKMRKAANPGQADPSTQDEVFHDAVAGAARDAHEEEQEGSVTTRAATLRLPDIRRQAEALAVRGETLDQLLGCGSVPSSKAFSTTFQPDTSAHTATFDPRNMLTVKASVPNKAIHITQFLPERTRKRRAARRKQLVVGTEEGAQTLVIQEDTEHPYAGISIEEWGGANARLMHHLLKTGALRTADVDYYLAYTANIFDLADKNSWDSVLDYDHTYRELQAEHQFLWGTASPMMDLRVLCPKPRGQTQTSNPARPTHGQGPRPNTGAADCKLFKARGSCPFGQGCKYRHVRQATTTGDSRKPSATSTPDQPKN